MVLTRGDLATLDTNGTARRARNVSLATYTSWMHGELVFDHVPVRCRIQGLERWYDIDVHVADPHCAPDESPRRFAARPPTQRCSISHSRSAPDVRQTGASSRSTRVIVARAVGALMRADQAMDRCCVLCFFLDVSHSPE